MYGKILETGLRETLRLEGYIVIISFLSEKVGVLWRQFIYWVRGWERRGWSQKRAKGGRSKGERGPAYHMRWLWHGRIYYSMYSKGGRVGPQGVDNGILSVSREREGVGVGWGVGVGVRKMEDLNNYYRGKVVWKDLGNRFEGDPEARGVHSDYQFPFREGRSAMKAVYILGEILEVGIRETKGYSWAVLDIIKAYNRVAREVLWDQMREVGYGGKVLRLIQRLYDENEGSFRLGGIQCSRMGRSNGLREDCIFPLPGCDLYQEGGRENGKECAGILR